MRDHKIEFVPAGIGSPAYYAVLESSPHDPDAVNGWVEINGYRTEAEAVWRVVKMHRWNATCPPHAAKILAEYANEQNKEDAA